MQHHSECVWIEKILSEESNLLENLNFYKLEFIVGMLFMKNLKFWNFKQLKIWNFNFLLKDEKLKFSSYILIQKHCLTS